MVGVLALVGGVVDAAEKKPARVDFVKQIKPILEYNCVACHREGYAEKQGGGYQLDVKEKAKEIIMEEARNLMGAKTREKRKEEEG